MKVGDVMTPDVEIVTPGDTLRTAARLMAELDAEALPVGKDDKLVGSISGREIAIHVAAEGCDPRETAVGEAMSADVLYCFAEERVEDVATKMSDWWVRRLPVIGHDRRLLGTVSLGDLTQGKSPAEHAGDGASPATATI